MAERRVSGAAGMMSGRNPSAPTPPSGYERVNGILQKVKGYTGAPPVTRGTYANTTPTGFKSPYIPTGRTKITNTGGASAMMSGNDPTAAIYSSMPQSTPSPFLKGSSETTKENPTENPTRPSQSTGGAEVPAFSYYDQARKANPEGTTRDFGKGYKEKELAAGQTAENSRAGAGFGGQTRVSPTGVVQKGTSTSPAPMTMDEANSLLSGGYTVRDPFSSTQLPASRQSPYENVGPIADGTQYARNLEMQKPGAVGGVGPIANGEQYAKNVEAGEQTALKPTDTGATSQNSGINWGARTAADNSDPKMARRRAFLDAEGSMQGLRRAEATQGIVYAGGQHHMVNPNRGKEGENDFVSIGDKDDVRGYKSGRLSAQDMKDKYVTKIKDNGITKYDEEKVSTTAGPVADAAAYGQHLQGQQDKYKMSGIGPVADGAQYAKSLGR